MQLDGGYRDVIVLFYYERCTIPEISRILECRQGTVKSEIVPGEGAVKGEAYMRDDFIDRKIRKMAEAERMAVPESLDAKVENILDGLETEKKDSKNTDGKRVNQTVRHYGFRRIVIPAAACLLLASVTVTASGLYRARMESMNHEKLETYFSGLQEADVAADSCSRPLTDGEKNRLEELRQAYLEEGYFPKRNLPCLIVLKNTKRAWLSMQRGVHFSCRKRK